MFATAILDTYKERCELVALCDTNQGRMDNWNESYHRRFSAGPFQTYGAAEFDKMIADNKPDVVVVTCIDRAHHEYICRAMELGCDVISVHFEWMMNTKHGADYFRRWHRDKKNSGGLMVHKSTHHFDLVNWWLDDTTCEVFGMGRLAFYGLENAENKEVLEEYRGYFEKMPKVMEKQKTKSRKLLILLISCFVIFQANAETWSWQKPHANVLPNGDLEWSPKPFVFEHGKSIRYIDFENGSDANNGTAKNTPWKHHPRDDNAKGKAAACKGIHTYVFKRGVIYRGMLLANDSGKPGNPIRLTSDPSWGKGEAAIYGSFRLTGGWKRCDAKAAPGIPDPKNVWMHDVAQSTVDCLWEIRDGKVNRIPIARDPNWTITDEDNPMEHWYAWSDSKRIGAVEVTNAAGKARLRGGKFLAQDALHVTSDDPKAYDGVWIWSTYDGNMSSPHRLTKTTYHPEHHAFEGIRNPQARWAVAYHKGAKYFMENLLRFLDAPGEFLFRSKGENSGRIYLRLPNDRNPNKSVVEIAKEHELINIVNQSHIEITGLSFSFNQPAWRVWPQAAMETPAIRIAGNCEDLKVANCRFSHLMSVVTGFPRLNAFHNKAYLRNDVVPPCGDTADVIDDITISDNDIAHIDSSAIYFASNWLSIPDPENLDTDPIGELKILRNRMYNIGQRQTASMYSAIPAIGIRHSSLFEVAGNIIDRCYGSGIWVRGGKNSGQPWERPMVRATVHHNKVTNVLLASNDWGGIETWQGGPIYIYNNISYNPIGPRHASAEFPNSFVWKNYSCNAFAYYLDGAFKQYLFNNIAIGKYNDKSQLIMNRCGGMMVAGYLNHWFNNSFHKFVYGMGGAAGTRNVFLGNVFSDISDMVFNQRADNDISLQGGGFSSADIDKMSNIATLAYKNNIFYQVKTLGGPVKGPKTVEQLQSALADAKTVSSETGELSKQTPFKNADQHDFRPAPRSPAINQGVKVFVPWSLYATVGEWNFRPFPANVQTILGENFFMTDEYIDRHKYYLIPQNNLLVPEASLEWFESGPLEDWNESALVFDGKTRFAVLKDSEIKADYKMPVTYELVENSKGPARYKAKRGNFKYPGARRRTVDMDNNNFLIEVYFKTEPGHSGGVLVSKADMFGYILDIDGKGRARMTLRTGGKDIFSRLSAKEINDGKWHHLIVEVDRKDTKKDISFYIDGKQANGPSSGTMPGKDVSLSNANDFFVGKGGKANFFNGAIDFLRVCRGTLADAKTTIGELYAWQFDGPFLRDFTGRKPKDGKRDAGAIEAM